MPKMVKNVLILSCCLLASIIPVAVSMADDDHGEHEGRYEHIYHYDDDDDHERGERSSLAPVNNGAVKQACGGCHIAYQPGLLPADSWEKLFSSLPSHFGEEIVLDQTSKKMILEYLHKNAADHSPAKHSRKIMRSLHGQTPVRITETPYFQEKHHGLPSGVFKLPAIGSKSNCVACHLTAEQGDYDDDAVKIPR
ncbi:MAG: diheme cytochrome c [Thermodesulfobacteriota bacterium]|nr:diheme cytochrome c [Thermodesulfobacteriota bacterium]